ncbi:DUF1905 domain-containing protein [Ornithinibacter aureus]|uniref:DUF1905 domain-containing protein n=1 Tax=Ornithinibacter aureus TaxID=622664 RepID=UPI00135C353F|nr:DUF1905 domain-containing protein [Ornithinibacter aureus]
MDLTFSAELFEWRGPAPHHWLRLPLAACEEIAAEAAETTYGWGAIPVQVQVGDTQWETSLLPREGGYVLPVKQAVRTREQIDLGDTVTVSLSVAPRHGRAANGTGRTG